jgi:ATP-dependent protease ClpP protease subunit
VLWIYTVDQTAETPIMLVNQHIGYDDQAGYGIMGPQFQREVLALDASGKRNIQVWINSPGGTVHDMEMMYSALDNCKAKVDTYNMGLCGSAAAVLFQVGRVRVMMDYSKLMYHGAQDGGSDILKKYDDSISTMISGKTGKSKEDVKAMMSRTTWMNAEQAEKAGFCDEVRKTSELNKGRLAKATNFHEEALQVMNSILNENKPSSKMLTRITNKLGLVEGTNEERIVEAIEKIETSSKAKDAELLSVKNVLTEKDSEITTLKNSLALLQKEKSDKEAADRDAKEVSLKHEAKEYVDKLVGDGKIKNDATIIAKTMDMYFKDAEGVKNIFDTMPINKKAPEVEDTTKKKELEKKNGVEGMPTNAMSKMAQIKNKIDNQK